MIDADKKIRKGLSAARKAECFQTQRDITIPAGTLLRHAGDNLFSAPLGIGSIVFHGEFVVEIKPGAELPGTLKRVIAS